MSAASLQGLPLYFWMKTGWNTKTKPEGYHVADYPLVIIGEDDSVSVNGERLRDPVKFAVHEDTNACRKNSHLLELTFKPYDGCPIDMNEGVPLVCGMLLPLQRILIDSTVSGVFVTLWIKTHGWDMVPAGE